MSSQGNGGLNDQTNPVPDETLDAIDSSEASETSGASEAEASDANKATGGTVAVPDDVDTAKSADVPASAEAGKLGGLWSVLVVGALITILILVFVLQNGDAADVQFLNWSFSLPLGVLILFSAIAGALVMAAFAGVRILQLRMRAHKAAKLRRKR